MTVSNTIAAPLVRFFGVLYRPEQEFERIGTEPKWLGSYVYLCAGKMVVEYLHLLVLLPVIRMDFSNSLSPSTAERTLWSLKTTSYITLTLTPAEVIIKALITAGLLYWLIILIDTKVKFKKLLSAAIHCWIIVLIARYCNLLILYLKGSEQLAHLNDLQVNLGLDILLKDNESVVMRTICESMTIFSLWYLVVLIIGAAIVSGISRKKASLIVIFIWTMTVAWKTGLSMWNRIMEAPFH
jgi:hypothetical protein